MRNRISLDLLSRVMVDLQQDSSKLIDSLVAEHQRGLLDIAYYDDRENRDKYTLILAESIEPKMPAAKYLDKEDYENELKQVLCLVLFLSHIVAYSKSIILPRQARDKRRETSKTRDRFLAGAW